MIVNKQGQVLLGLKKKGFHAGNWIFPGGGIEFGESVAECGIREVKEETTLDIEVKGMINVVAETAGEKHVVFLNLLAAGEGQPVVTEPEEVILWNWYHLNQLPGNITHSALKAIHAYNHVQAVIPVI